MKSVNNLDLTMLFFECFNSTFLLVAHGAALAFGAAAKPKPKPIVQLQSSGSSHGKGENLSKPK